MDRIDLNSDVGESFGAWSIGADPDLIPLVTSVNVACGLHAGDPLVIDRTVALAAASGAAIGAHPGYPDLAGFGRRDLDMTPAELEAAILYQVAAVAGFARAAGRELAHVKAHGALYNRAARDATVARSIARATRRFSTALVFVGLAGSTMLDVARDEGLEVAAEAFADRRYEPDGSLRPRRLEGALLADPEAAAVQAVGIATKGVALTLDGGEVRVAADTICVHGDTPDAVSYARAIRAALERSGVQVRALGG